MAQFLSGILPLKIETGRFKKIRNTSSGKLRCLNSQKRICEIIIMYFIRTRSTETTTHTIHNYFGTHYYQPCPGII